MDNDPTVSSDKSASAVGTAPVRDIEAEREEFLRQMRTFVSPDIQLGIEIALASMPDEKVLRLEFVTSGTTYANT